MTMKRTLFRRHNFKKSLKSAANLIFAIKWFAEFFKGVKPFGRGCSAPVGTGLGLGFGEAICNNDLPFRTSAGSAGLGGGESGR